MSDYLLDTNILIRLFRKTTGFLDLLTLLAGDDVLYISVVTRLEVIRGMQEHERDATHHLLDSFETIAITLEVADKAGELIRIFRKQGVTLEDIDALIAATALQHGLALVTTNAKHFPMPDLVVFQANDKGKLTLRK
ncbi:MAG: type II toxin-antitoxin system VapC family toxin [Chloroflexota bacterium]